MKLRELVRKKKKAIRRDFLAQRRGRNPLIGKEIKVLGDGVGDNANRNMNDTLGPI